MRCADTCGSNSMLPRELNGVVDPQLKVYGTTNIRVCDISVVPLMPAVHPQGASCSDVLILRMSMFVCNRHGVHVCRDRYATFLALRHV